MNPSSAFPKINLLPREVRDARKFELWYPWIWTSVAILLLIVFIAFLLLTVNRISLEQELQATQAEVATTRAQSETLKEYEDLRIFVDGRQVILEETLAERLDPYLIGVALTKELPSSVSIERIIMSEESGLEINASVEDSGKNPPTKDWHAVAKTIDALEESPLFKNLWLDTGAINDTYSNYEENDNLLPAKRQYNFPDVVNQFRISSDLRLTLNPTGDEPTWTDRLNPEEGN